MDKQFIIVQGNPVDGMTYHGPFTEEQWDWVSTQFEGDWWRAEVAPIEEQPPSPQGKEFNFVVSVIADDADSALRELSHRVEPEEEDYGSIFTCKIVRETIPFDGNVHATVVLLPGMPGEENQARVFGPFFTTSGAIAHAKSYSEEWGVECLTTTIDSPDHC